MLKLALFPLHTVLFPGMALPLHIFEPRYRRMIHACLADESPFGVVLIRAGREVGGPAVPYTVGTLARIRRVEHLPDGRMNIEAVGDERFRLLQLYAAQDEVHTGRIVNFPLLGASEAGATAAARALSPWLSRYLSLLGQSAATHFAARPLPTEPAALAYFAAVVAQIPAAEKQALLSVETAARLLNLERTLYRREISLLRAMLGADRTQLGQAHSPN
jgi:Lon protease-like protein